MALTERCSIMARCLCALVCVCVFGNPTLAQVRMVIDDYAVQQTDCGGTVQLGTGSTGPFTLAIPPPDGFPVGCRVTVFNADIGRGKFLFGAAVAAYELPTLLFPRQSFMMQVGGTGWDIIKVPGRWLAPANTTFYVDVANGDDSNDGLAPGAGNAWKTTLQAITVLKQSVDFGLTWRGPIYVALADSDAPYASSKNSGIWVNGPFLGAATNDSGIDAESCPLVFKGNTENPAKVVVSSTAGDGVTGIGGTFFCVQDMELIGVSSDLAAGGASVIRFGNVILGPSDGAKVRSGHGSAIENYPDTTIHLSGNSPSVFWGLVNGNIYITGATLSVDSDLTVNEFVLAESGGGLYYRRNTITGRGAITGAKFQLKSAGYIDTGTNDLALLPGTLPGRFKGGVYDEQGLPATSADK